MKWVLLGQLALRPHVVLCKGSSFPAHPTCFSPTSVLLGPTWLQPLKHYFLFFFQISCVAVILLSSTCLYKWFFWRLFELKPQKYVRDTVMQNLRLHTEVKQPWNKICHRRSGYGKVRSLRWVAGVVGVSIGMGQDGMGKHQVRREGLTHFCCLGTG